MIILTNVPVYQFPFVSGEMPGYDVLQLVLVIALGVMGGLFGALFCRISYYLVSLRIRYLTTPTRKIVEVWLQN